MSQKDLFEFSSRSAVLPQASVEHAPKTAFSFLEQTRVSLRLDHLLTLSIALMVSTALVYASGIEKGKRSAWKPKPAVVSGPAIQAEGPLPVEIKVTDGTRSMLPKAGAGELLSASSVSTSSSSYSKTETMISTKKTSTPDGSFTIQLATYKAESIAQKRVEALSSQGLDSFLIPSGSYYQVCVNGFSKKVEATQSLTRLKSKGIAPRDAYVRMIPA